MIAQSHIDAGERLRDEGMTLAADASPSRVTLGRLRMLRAMLASRDGTATINDGTPPDEIASGYADGGHWRGTVTRSLAADGYTEPTGEYRRTSRPSAHRRPNAVWRLVDRPAAIADLARLTAALAVNDATPSDDADGAANSDSTTHTTDQGDMSDESK